MEKVRRNNNPNQKLEPRQELAQGAMVKREKVQGDTCTSPQRAGGTLLSSELGTPDSY